MGIKLWAINQGANMINKSIDKIDETDLQALIEMKESEGKTIEYKRSLPSASDRSKTEFLADISSFANSSGGDLIYGMVEDKGIPKALDGLTIEDYDQEKQRLENLVRNGIEPRISSLYIHRIPLSNANTAIIIRIPKSWSSPHRVRYQGHDKFYSRNSAGKYPLDVAELRIAFNLSETTAEKIRRFRQDRISNIVANETPVLLPDTAKIALHLIPITAFSSAQSYEINKISSNPGKMRPMFSSGWSNRYNLDGFLTYAGDAKQSHSYVQLFRNGTIEAVETSMLEPNNHRLYIPSVLYEHELINSLSDYLSLLETLTVEPPIFASLTLLGVKGYRMGTGSIRHEHHAIDRDIILLPESHIESYQVVAEDVLRPCFDSIWNACGFPKSLNYNQDGKWIGK
jgi:hypothetical protein